MLEETTDDAHDPYTITQARDAGAQAADTADDQVDLDAGLRCAIQRVDDLRIHERVHLADDARGPSRGGIHRFSIDQLDEPRAQIHRRDEQLAIETLARVPGQR